MSDQRILKAIEELGLYPDYIPEYGKPVIAIGFDLVVGDGVTPLKNLEILHVPIENNCLIDTYNQYNHSQLEKTIDSLEDITINFKRRSQYANSRKTNHEYTTHESK